MRIVDFFIRKPTIAFVFNLIFIVLGILSYFKLEIREYPPLETPVLSVSTDYKGANPEIIESQITKILEKKLSQINGLDYIDSYNNLGSSWINLFFKPYIKVDEALSEVRAILNKTQNKLPENCEAPEIHQQNKDSKSIVTLVLTNQNLTETETTAYAKSYLGTRFKSIEGVSEIKVQGSDRVIDITINPIALASQNLTISEIIEALNRYKNFSAGFRQIGPQRISVTVSSKLASLEQLKDLVIKTSHGSPTKLKDMAKVNFTIDPHTISSFLNQKPATLIQIFKASTANPIKISNQVHKVLEEIQLGLPQDMVLTVVDDHSTFIREAISSVQKTIFESIILVTLIVFLFLRSWRGTLIPIIAIPFSLIATFLILYIFGYSINRLTLLAFVLAIGLVVDDAIVVLENIHRHLERGETALQAALKGTKEIAFSIVAMTVTLAAVYTPLLFTAGLTGKLFQEFAVALAGAVIISGIVALTFSPALSVLIFKSGFKKPEIINKLPSFYETKYLHFLNFLLEKRIKVIFFGIIGVFGLGYILFENLPKELIPPEDRGIIHVGSSSEGLTQKYIHEKSADIYKVLNQIPDIQTIKTTNFENYQEIDLILKPFKDRKQKSKHIIEKLDETLQIPSMWAWTYEESPFQSGGNHSIEFIIQSRVHKKNLEEMAQSLLQRARKNPGFKHVHLKSAQMRPAFHIALDRGKLSAFGVEINDIEKTLSAAFGGYRGVTFETHETEHKILLKTQPHEKVTDILSSHYVKATHNQQKNLIPLSSFIKEEVEAKPNFIYRFNQVPSISLNVTLKPGYTLEQGLNDLYALAKTNLPAEVQTDLGGSTRQYKENAQNFFLLFGLGLFFVYLILVAQFESFIDPFIILISVPLASVGGLLLLKLFGQTLNIYSQIGLITLIGLITKHGILLVDFANKNLKKHKTAVESILESVKLRMRPILMTTGAMVFGAIPLVIARGVGAESYISIGLTLIGGLVLGTVLTLLFIPCVYVMVKTTKNNQAPNS
jgi:multidrug efflux pump